MNDRATLLTRLAPLALIVVIGLAVLVRMDAGTQLATPDSDAVTQLDRAFDGAGPDPLVLVGFDPDIGTWAEIRPTVRTMLAELLDRGGRLALISLTVEGRALAVAELGRLARLKTNPDRLVDLGFVPGAEAALVAVARSLTGGTPDELAPLDGLEGSAPSLAVVVGGNDLGPRSWVEQVAPRLPDLPIVAVSPAVLLPELVPYLDSGQLAALVATPRDGAAYRERVELGTFDRFADREGGPAPLAVLAGMLVAIGVLALALAGRDVRPTPPERT